MDFDAYKYARTFEKLACKIIEKELSEKIIVSGITQKTRDNGIDAIIYSTDSYITIEAKLRKSSSSLGLKDIASSVIFYLLRLNDKHYIVSNVYLTMDTINVLNRLNKASDAGISYIDGDSTIRILKENMDSLDEDEKELAGILLEEFNSSKANNSHPSQTPKESKIASLKIQHKLSNQVCTELLSGRKCTVLSGKIGIGKSVILNMVMDKLSQSHNTIFIDCQKYNTIEAFMYQISNLEIGIDINELISEYISISDDINNSSDLISIDSSNILKTLAQVLSTNKYVDNIKFIAKEYINNLINRFNSGNLYIFIDNYSAASLDLADFISSYIISSVQKLKFFIVRDTDNCDSSSSIAKILNSPINAEKIKELHVYEYDNNEIGIFIDFLRHDLPQVTKNNLYRHFGGNLLMIKLALDEMENKKNYDPSLLRPKRCEQIYADRINCYIKSDITYIKAFFVCWVMGSRISYEMSNLLGDCDINDLLGKTGIFNDNDTSLSLCNICVYKVISEYYIYTATAFTF